MKKNKFDYTEAVIYRTVESDLTDLENITYDMIVFFSPSGVQSLFKNFPDFKQNNTKIAAFGTVTGAAIKKAGLRLDMQAPMPKVPSITMAIDRFLQENNN